MCKANPQTFMARIVPVLYRNRSHYNDENPITMNLCVVKPKAKNTPNPIEESKVVEISDEEENEGEGEDEAKPSRQNEEPVFGNELMMKQAMSILDDGTTEEDLEVKRDNLIQSISAFTKLILTEGIENTQNMPDISELLGGLGEDGNEMNLLSSMMMT